MVLYPLNFRYYKLYSIVPVCIYCAYLILFYDIVL